MSGYSGMWAWLIQRFSGIYIAAYLLVTALIVAFGGPWDAQEWQGLFASPLMQAAASVFIVALLFHAWIGLRDVVLDYIHPIAIKVPVLLLILAMLLASGFWFLRALIQVDPT